MSKYAQPDHWSLKARREGYPARSVYKLQELDEKFQLLAKPRGKGPRPPASFRVLDLGAAPGSWSLYVLRNPRFQGSLVAADLAPLSRGYDRGLFARDNFFFIQGDITNRKVRELLQARGPYQVILSDAAPATTGNRTVDVLQSLALAEAVLAYAEACLASGGNLAVKIFQGEGTDAALKHIRSRFAAGRSFKPRACRKDSFETYLVGLDKRPMVSP
ncbi:MAG: RlmE family RNA methyltransferase [Treponema sp.]|nr:RlmE family RNA methyltransferase [Treponema sp.]